MHINNLTQSNISALFEGLTFLNLVDDVQYQSTYEPVFNSTIGAHFRHVLEHYQCFFNQREQQHFCYDSRPRNLKLEVDVEYAKTTLSEIITSLHDIDFTASPSIYHLSDESINADIETSLLRELAFLQSHTTHHYAIIAAIARSLGLQPQKDFGVAIATRNYQEMLQAMDNLKCAP